MCILAANRFLGVWFGFIDDAGVFGIPLFGGLELVSLRVVLRVYVLWLWILWVVDFVLWVLSLVVCSLVFWV